jgi:hypothetical protein
MVVILQHLLLHPYTELRSSSSISLIMSHPPVSQILSCQRLLRHAPKCSWLPGYMVEGGVPPCTCISSGTEVGHHPAWDSAVWMSSSSES